MLMYSSKAWQAHGKAYFSLVELDNGGSQSKERYNLIAKAIFDDNEIKT